MSKQNIIIIGAAGRDFHNFNILFRDNDKYNVVAFTAAQIPYIQNRNYPNVLSGKNYPEGIPIYDESKLPTLIKKFSVDVCILSYSDLNYSSVMAKASICNSCGADFWLLAPERTMIQSIKPVIAICAVRTGCGKSQTTRYVANLLRDKGFKVVIVRHPMPYGILKDQIVERFETLKDLNKYKCTIEEREEYEQHIKNRFIVYAGVDYLKILHEAEKEADIIIFDGGNNDAPFYKPNLLITVADPLRAGNELSYYPGEIVVRMADLLLINKINSAKKEDLEKLKLDLAFLNKTAHVVLAKSIISVDNKGMIKDKRVLLVGDGPTITHGNMEFSAATIAANEFGAKEIVDARKEAVGTIKDTYKKYPKLGHELPAMGYNKKQIIDLQNTINLVDCDAVISATPINLRTLININKPIVQVSYDLKPVGKLFENVLENFINKFKR